MFREEFITLSAYVKKRKDFKSITLFFTLRHWKKEQIKCKADRMKEIRLE